MFKYDIIPSRVKIFKTINTIVRFEIYESGNMIQNFALLSFSK